VANVNVKAADLSVDAETLAAAQATLNEAANRLAPVLKSVQSLDAEVVGADPLVQALMEIHSALAAELITMGEGATNLAEYIEGVGKTMDGTDQALSLALRNRAQ
jgi:hypothetical protein